MTDRGKGRWLSPQQVADRLGVHMQTVKRIPPDELPYWRAGPRGDRKYDPADVDAYVKARTVTR